jgi:flagellar basal-body rod modification protein FlgD
MVDSVTSTGLLGTGNSSRTALAENFDMFLVLLTEQLKNQDPLSPLDSEQFVGQLVDFSSVEQQISQTEHLQTLISLQRSQDSGAAVSFLGRELSWNDATNWSDGTGASWQVTQQDFTKGTAAVVVDELGRVVYEAELSSSPGRFDVHWDGYDNKGNPLPPGAYTLQVAGLTDAGDSARIDIASRGIASAVDYSGAEASLLVGDLTVSMNSILSVKDVARQSTTA